MSNERKCPAATSKVRFMLNILLALLGAAGLYYLSIWVSVVYFVGFFVFFFVIMPMTICQYCYFRGDAPLKEWKENTLPLHSDRMKKWGSAFFLVWAVPIVGIIISFFVNFSIYAVVCLVGVVIIVIVNMMALSRTICVNCEILEYCPIRKPRGHGNR